MNQIRLLRLDSNRRRQYIQKELQDADINGLRHLAAEYGIKNSSLMGRDELLQVIIDGLDAWAEAEILQ